MCVCVIGLWHKYKMTIFFTKMISRAHEREELFFNGGGTFEKRLLQNNFKRLKSPHSELLLLLLSS